MVSPTPSGSKTKGQRGQDLPDLNSNNQQAPSKLNQASDVEQAESKQEEISNASKEDFVVNGNKYVTQMISAKSFGKEANDVEASGHKVNYSTILQKLKKELNAQVLSNAKENQASRLLFDGDKGGKMQQFTDHMEKFRHCLRTFEEF